MSHEPNDFEIIEAALTGWDEPVPQEVPPALAALDRIKKEIEWMSTQHNDEASVGQNSMAAYEMSSTAKRMLNQ